MQYPVQDHVYDLSNGMARAMSMAIVGKQVDIIPLEVVCRNVAAGSISKRLGIEEGTPLPRSIIEFYYKKDELGDPMVSEEHITAFNWANPQEIDDMISMTIRVNDFLCGMFATIGIKLIDFKLEYGYDFKNNIFEFYMIQGLKWCITCPCPFKFIPLVPIIWGERG